MNPVIMRLTARSLLGRRRAILFALLPGILLIVAGSTRWGSSADPWATAHMLHNFAMSTVLPLVCLIIGTGAIGPEIEDGSIVYLLAKPISRTTIALSKLVVAVSTALAMGAVPIALAGAIAGDWHWKLTLAYGTSAALGAVAYTTVFFTLAVFTRNAIISGLIYALFWEGVIGGYVPGVRVLSIRQWILAPAEEIAMPQASTWGVSSQVGLSTGLVLIVITTVLAAALAARRLQTISVRGGE